MAEEIKQLQNKRKNSSVSRKRKHEKREIDSFIKKAVYLKVSLPTVEKAWAEYKTLLLANQHEEIARRFGDKTQPSFVVDVADIVENGYDLSINRYKEVVHQEQEYDPPCEILARIESLEVEIQQELAELKALINA